ncbi:sugar transferase [Burkholderia gladioli]|uniref:Exopolysaccharide biosynthesis polyprenyl glycosylphosphotransferase n=1 Tax=Burkholderia gladioli (strain BSR3) TaxID=999541 RepID=F2LEK9_BURGS|nr:sugar transferase [Burkholderia gladioli]AEA60668.1 exopolysaccharide biosynthesis polyprenyl glycosylphosphotransferase [Burkholderia gladioli BSR3]MBW5287441.1 sugar transferase [Burkholderia gladioli]
MRGLIWRLVDGTLIIVGALCALHFELMPPSASAASGFDGLLVAFAVALALSVFPACDTYGLSGVRSVFNLISRTIIAWLFVQACGFLLLFVLHRLHLVSRVWFLYWTITSGLGMLIARTLALTVLKTLWRFGARAHELAARADMRLATHLARRTFKRGFDTALVIPMLVALSPLFLILALLVRRDGGPAIYGHLRVGRDGRAFRCLKFRTMVTNSDAVLRELLACDPQARAEWERDFKLKHDVRVTRVGHFLRSTSLDELPQLWNVLRGEMSLVGPRPIVEKELERYGLEARYYLMAKPGITGLWQVSGRSDVDYARRVSLDVSYVKQWTPMLDFGILLRTVGVVMRREGAY